MQQAQQDQTPYYPEMGDAWAVIGGGRATAADVTRAWEAFTTPLTEAYMDTVEIDRWDDGNVNIQVELTSPADGSRWVLDIGASPDGSWIQAQPATGATDGFDFAPTPVAGWGGPAYGAGSVADDAAWLDAHYGSGGSYAAWSHAAGTGTDSGGYYGDWSWGGAYGGSDGAGYNAYGIWGADNIY